MTSTQGLDTTWSQQIMTALSPHRPTTRKPLSDFTTSKSVSVPTYDNALVSLEKPKDIESDNFKRQPLEIEVIDLKRISSEWPLFLDAGLLVTEDYRTVKTFIDEQFANEGKRRGLAIIGTPGTGKSTFLLYLLMHRISEGKETIYKASNSFTYWFHEDVVERFATVDLIHEISSFSQERRRLIALLCDSVEPDLSWSTLGIYVILATSPRLDRFKEWAKQIGATYCFLDVWTWAEFACLKYVNNTSQSMKNLWILYCRYGGIPQLITELAIDNETDDAFLAKLAIYEKFLMRIATAHAMKDLSFRAQLELSADVSHSLVVTRPDPAFKPDPDLRLEKEPPQFISRHALPYQDFATLHVATIVAAAYKASERFKTYDFFSNLLHDSFMRSPMGFVYEDMVLSVISYNHINNVTSESRIYNLNNPKEDYGVAMDDLSQVKEVEILVGNEMTQLQQCIFDNKGSLLLRPESRNLASIDRIYVLADQTPLLLQVTLSEVHPIKVSGLHAIWKVLPQQLREKGLKLVFITPDTNSFGKQSYTPHSAQTLWDKRVTQGHIRVCEKKLHKIWTSLKLENKAAIL